MDRPAKIEKKRQKKNCKTERPSEQIRKKTTEIIRRSNDWAHRRFFNLRGKPPTMTVGASCVPQDYPALPLAHQ